MGYVLICHGNGKFDGAYVAPPGSEQSYTHNILEAKIFRDKQDAQEHACGNESPHSVESQFPRN